MSARTCFTCGAEVDAHAAYCDPCIADQLREQGDEMEAFDAFHAWANAVSKPREVDA